MRPYPVSFSLLLFCLFSFCFTSHAPAASQSASLPKRIFIVQSYGDRHVCGLPQAKGIRNVLQAALNPPPEIRTYYMDTKTRNVSPEAMKKEAALARAAISQFSPDLLFTVDDNAFRELAQGFIDAPFPVIFTGLNRQPALYNEQFSFLNAKGLPDKNITGVYETLHFVSSVQIMGRILPKLSGVMVLLDKTPTGMAIRDQIQMEVAKEPPDFPAIRFSVVGTMAEYQAAIRAINADPAIDAIYPVVLSLVTDTGERIGFTQTLGHLIANATKPGMAVNFAYTRFGLFGGASVDFEAMGKQAGEIGLACLAGTPVSEIPIEDAKRYVLTFNAARARQLQISLPPELVSAAEIYNTIAAQTPGSSP